MYGQIMGVNPCYIRTDMYILPENHVFSVISKPLLCLRMEGKHIKKSETEKWPNQQIQRVLVHFLGCLETD